MGSSTQSLEPLKKRVRKETIMSRELTLEAFLSAGNEAKDQVAKATGRSARAVVDTTKKVGSTLIGLTPVTRAHLEERLEDMLTHDYELYILVRDLIERVSTLEKGQGIPVRNIPEDKMPELIQEMAEAVKAQEEQAKKEVKAQKVAEKKAKKEERAQEKEEYVDSLETMVMERLEDMMAVFGPQKEKKPIIAKRTSYKTPKACPVEETEQADNGVFADPSKAKYNYENQ